MLKRREKEKEEIKDIKRVTKRNVEIMIYS